MFPVERIYVNWIKYLKNQEEPEVSMNQTALFKTFANNPFKVLLWPEYVQ